MPDTHTSAQKFPCSAVAGRSFVLAARSRDRSAVEETVRLLTSLGGRVVEVVTPAVGYVVVVDRHLDRPTPEERQAGVQGVPALDRAGFYGSSLRPVTKPLPSCSVGRDVQDRREQGDADGDPRG